MDNKEEMQILLREAHSRGDRENAEKLILKIEAMGKVSPDQKKSVDTIKPIGDIPEIGSLPLPFFDKRTAKTAWGLAMSTTDKDRAEVVSKNFPDASFRIDDEGNYLVKIPGYEEAYLNKPGISMGDATSIGAQAPLYIGGIAAASRIPMLGKTAYGAVRPFMSGAIGSGGASMATDVLRGDDIEVGRAAETALIGGVAEKYLAPAIGWIWQKTGGKMFTPKGNLTDEAKVFADKIGVTEDEVSQVIKKTGLKNDDAVLAAAFEKQGIPYTRGDVTTKPGSIHKLEQSALEGRQGAGTQEMVGKLRASQAEKEMGTYVDVLGGGSGDVVSGGAGVQTTLEKMRLAAKSKSKKLFDIAKNNNVLVNDDAASALNASLIKNVTSEYAEDTIPTTLSTINKFLGSKVKAAKIEGKPLTINDMFVFRRKLGEAARRSRDPAESSALNSVKADLDKTLDAMAEHSLMTGDDTAIAAWKKAISQYADYSAKFKSKDIVGKILKKDFTTGEYDFRVAPEQVSNFIYGVTDNKLMNSPEIVRQVKKMRNLLGEDSVQWNVFKQESFMRLFRKAIRGRAVPTNINEFAETFKPEHFNQAWTKLKQQNPKLVSTVFNERERQLIERMAVISQNIAKTPPDKLANNAFWQNSLHRQATRIAYVKGTGAGGFAQGHMWSGIVDMFINSIKMAARGSAKSAIMPPTSPPSPAISGTIVPMVQESELNE